MSRPDGERLARARAAVEASYGQHGEDSPAATLPEATAAEDMQLALSRVRGLVSGSPPAARQAGGWLRRMLRRALGRLVRFETYWQHQSNAAVLGALEDLSRSLAAGHAAGARRLAATQEQLQELAVRVAEERQCGTERETARDQELGDLQTLIREAVRRGGDLRQELQATDRRLAQVEETAVSRRDLDHVAGSLRAAAARHMAELGGLASRLEEVEDHQHLESAQVDAISFMERFRGSEEEIQRRLQPYVELLSRSGKALPGPLLDVGCGRGEMLELCRRHAIPAQGMEQDPGLVQRLRSRGLEVEENDALVGLRRHGPATLGAIFSTQLIEHLPPGAIVQLIAEAHRVLAPGGMLIMETLNPASLAMLANTFYRDPGHRQPMHAETAGFLLESAGFQDVQVVQHTPVLPEHALQDVTGEADAELRAGINRNVRILNHLLFGPQEYHVIGVRR